MNLKNIWAWVLSAFGLLIGAFFYERNQKQNAEAELINAKTKEQDAALGQHTEDLNQKVIEANKEAEEKKATPATPEELLDFLNKKNK